MAKASTKPTSTAVAPRKATTVSTKVNYAEDAGAGFEGAGKDAYAIPFLVVLQSMSPQLKKSDGKYIKGAEEGMLLNTVTNELFDGEEGVEIIPCAYAQTFIEWGQREKGGGFIAEYPPDVGSQMKSTARRDDKGRDILPNSHQLNDHRNHYLLIKDGEGKWQPIMLSVTSTQIKASRVWMSNMQRIATANAVPMFAQVWRVTTVAQSNEKGTWSGLVFEHEGFIEDPEVYAMAKAFYAQVRAGAVKTQPRDDDGNGTSSDPDDM